MPEAGFISSRAEYEPSPTVESFSGLGGDEEVSMEAMYLNSIITLPIMYVVVGMGCIGLFCLVMVCRCCFPCFKCAPKPGHPTITKNDGSTHYAKDWSIFGPFFFFLAAVIISCFTVFKGAGTVQEGFDAIDGSLTSLQSDVFQDMADKAAIMGVEADIGYDIANAGNDDSNCDDIFETFKGVFEGLQTAADGFESAVESVPDSLQMARDYTAQIAAAVAFLIFGLFCFFLSIAGAYIGLEFCELKCLMKLLMLFTVVVETIATLLLGAILCLQMFLSDWCMDPLNILLRLILEEEPDVAYANAIANDEEGTNAMLLFYLYRKEDGTVCSGKDVVGDLLASITDAVDDIQDVFEDEVDDGVLTACPEITNIQTALDDTSAALTAALAEADCRSINKAFTEFVEDGLCGLTTGMGEIWTAQFFTATWLFIVMALAGVTYEYFGHVESVVPDNEGDVEMVNKSSPENDLPDAIAQDLKVSKEEY